MPTAEILNVKVDIDLWFAPTLAIRPYISAQSEAVDWFSAVVRVYHSVRIGR